jgi:hypothetical protein
LNGVENKQGRKVFDVWPRGRGISFVIDHAIHHIETAFHVGPPGANLAAKIGSMIVVCGCIGDDVVTPFVEELLHHTISFGGVISGLSIYGGLVVGAITWFAESAAHVLLTSLCGSTTSPAVMVGTTLCIGLLAGGVVGYVVGDAHPVKKYQSWFRRNRDNPASWNRSCRCRCVNIDKFWPQVAVGQVRKTNSHTARARLNSVPTSLLFLHRPTRAQI